MKFIKKLWSSEIGKGKFKYYSGYDDHIMIEFTKIYINKIKEFLQLLPIKPDVVDLGCTTLRLVIR